MNEFDGIDALLSTGRQILAQLAAFAPNLLTAIGLLAAGWLVGTLLSRGVVKLIHKLASGFEERAARLTLRRLGIERSLADLIGRFTFWVVLAVFAAAALETFGLPLLAIWVGQLGDLLPRLFVGGLIVFIGLLAGALARDAAVAAARSGDAMRARVLGRVVQTVIVAAAVVTGLDQVGVDSRFLTVMIAVTVGGVFGGTALAFALGARAEVGNIVAMHYVRQTFSLGQRIRVGGVDGRIHAFTTTSVIVGTGHGLLHLPGSKFSDQITEVPPPEDPGGS